jgi:hypothetical protein
MAKCDLPPSGWNCNKEAGHAGPCPARHNRPIAKLQFYKRASMTKTDRRRVVRWLLRQAWELWRRDEFDYADDFRAKIY